MLKKPDQQIKTYDCISKFDNLIEYEKVKNNIHNSSEFSSK